MGKEWSLFTPTAERGKGNLFFFLEAGLAFRIPLEQINFHIPLAGLPT